MRGLARSLRGLAFGALLALLAFSAVAPSGAYDGWPLAVLQLLALVGVTALALSMLLEGRFEWARSPLGLPFILFAALAVVQMALGNGPLAAWALAPAGGPFTFPDRAPGPFFLLGTVSGWATRQAFLLLLTYGAVYLLVVNLAATRRRLDSVVKLLLVAGGLMAFLGLIESVRGALGILPALSSWVNAGRAQGAFDNADHFATWLGMLLCLGAGFLIAQHRRQGKSSDADGEPLFASPLSRHSRTEDPFFLDLLLFFGVVMMGLTLVFTLSRAGVASAFLALAALAVMLRSRRIGRRGNLLLVSVVLVVLAWAAWLGLEPMLRRLDTAEASYLFRWRIYLASLPILADYPLLGTGLGTYGEVIPLYQPAELSPADLEISNVHNDYLQLLTETGPLGLLILALAAWRFYRDMVGAHAYGRRLCPHWRAAWDDEASPRRRDRYALGIGLGAVAGTVMAAVHSVLDFGLRIPANGVLLAALCGIATVALHHRFRGEESEPLVPLRVLKLPAGSALRPVAACASLVAAALLGGLVVAPHAVAQRVTAARELIASPPLDGQPPSLIQGLGVKREALGHLAGGGPLAFLDPGDRRPVIARAAILEEFGIHAWNAGVAPDGRLLDGPARRGGEATRLLEDALAEYERAARLTPTRALTQQQLGWLWGNLAVIGETAGLPASAVPTSAALARALAAFGRAIALGRENPEPYQALALFVATHAETTPGVAALLPLGTEAARRAVALEPARLPALFAAYLPLLGKRVRADALAPDTPEDRIHLATLLEREERPAEADLIYKQAIAAAPPGSQPLVRRLYARSLARQGRAGEIPAQIEIALRYDPADPAGHLAMAEALAFLKQPARALDFYKSALAAAEQRARTPGRPGPPPPRKTPGPLTVEERRAELLRQLARVQLGAPLPPQVSLTYPYRLALGRFFVAQKEYRQAIPILEELTQEHLEDAAAQFALGQAYDAIGAWEGAVGAYKKAIELTRDEVAYRVHLAQRYFDNERFYQAIEIWQSVARLQPMDVQARLNMARGYVKVGDPLQAVRAYERVLQIEPGNPVALQGLQTVRGRLAGGGGKS